MASTALRGRVQRCRCPGFITVISNLTDSFHTDEALHNATSERWMSEYFEGSNNAIYGMLVSARFAGCSWSEMAWLGQLGLSER